MTQVTTNYKILHFKKTCNVETDATFKAPANKIKVKLKAFLFVEI